MVKTAITTTLFKDWTQADAFVALAEAAGWSVEETERDILTVRDGNRMGSVGLALQVAEPHRVLAVAPFRGAPVPLPLSTGAAAMFELIREEHALA
jgi:hypothetical protein